MHIVPHAMRSPARMRGYARIALPVAAILWALAWTAYQRLEVAPVNRSIARLGSSDPLKAADARDRLAAMGAKAVPYLEDHLEYRARPGQLRRVLNLLRDRSEKDLRLPVIDTLRRIGEPAVPALLPLLDHPARDIRAAALHALGTLRLERVLPQLLRASSDPDARVRRAAVIAVGHTPGPGRRKVIVRRIADTNGRVRVAAARAAVELDAPGETVPALLTQLRVEHRRLEKELNDGENRGETKNAIADARRASAAIKEALRAIGPAGAIPALRVLNRLDWNVRPSEETLVLSMLGNAPDTASYPLLVKGVFRAPRWWPIARSLAAGEHGFRERFVDDLIAAMVDTDRSHRAWSALVRITGKNLPEDHDSWRSWRRSSGESAPTPCRQDANEEQ